MVKKAKEKLIDKIYDVYMANCPLSDEQEKEILSIRTNYEAELLETAKWVQREGRKRNKTDKEIEDKIDEYDEKLELKYMKFELEYLKTLDDEQKENNN